MRPAPKRLLEATGGERGGVLGVPLAAGTWLRAAGQDGMGGAGVGVVQARWGPSHTGVSPGVAAGGMGLRRHEPTMSLQRERALQGRDQLCQENE